MSMKLPFIVLFIALALGACSKKQQPAGTAATAASEPVASQPAVPPADTASSEEASARKAELAKKQAQLDYATMEDSYINDPHGQWASSAKASSTFGDDRGQPGEVNQAANITGKVDGKSWTNNSQNIGFDTVEIGIDKPVSATEVRFVFPGGKTVKAVSKVELIDAEGALHAVWSGVSDTQPDERGDRTWFVRQFEATPYKVKGAKLTIANNLDSNYKEIDAAQIVGQ